MAYCTFDYLKTIAQESVLLTLCDDGGIGAFVVSPPNAPYQRLIAAIAEADTIIDSYLSSRYSIPFDPVPDIIRKISASLAICQLHERTGDAFLPEGVVAKSKVYMGMLKEMQEGKMSIPGLEKPAAQPQAYITNNPDNNREFSDSLLKVF